MRSTLEKIILFGSDTGMSSTLDLTPPPPPMLHPPSPYQHPPPGPPSYGQPPPFPHQPPPSHNLPYRQPSPAPPIPWLLISPTEIRSSTVPTPLFTITKSTAPGSLSSKSLVTLTRTASHTPLGTIRFHSSTGALDLALHAAGRDTKLKDATSLSTTPTFKLSPTSAPGTTWFWRAHDGGTFVLTEGHKNGRPLATVNGSTLVCENLPFPDHVVDEIVLSAVAVLMKNKKLGEQAEGIEAVAEVLGALGGGGG